MDMIEKDDHQVERAGLIAAHLDLQDDLLPHVEEHLGELLGGAAPVIWIQGQNCTGCTVTLLNSDHFNPRNLGYGKLCLRYQPNMMSAEGSKAIEVIEQTEKEFAGKYVWCSRALSRPGTERRSALSGSPRRQSI